MAKLCVESFLGRRRVSVLYGLPSVEQKLRAVRLIDLPDADAGLPLPVLERLYKDQIAGGKTQ